MDIRRIEVVDDAIAEILRRKTPAERLALAFDCNRTVRLRIESHLRSAHPEWTHADVANELRRRLLCGAA